MKRGRGMTDRVHKSRGMVTLITEALARIKPTDPLKLAKLVPNTHFLGLLL